MYQTLHSRDEVHLDRFDSAWHSETVPEIELFVRELREQGDPAAITPGLICELVRIDLECRWSLTQKCDARAHGISRRQVEDYLRAFPELNDTYIVSLLVEEFRVRKKWGDCPGPEEYLRRFPATAPQLQAELAQVQAELALSEQITLPHADELHSRFASRQPLSGAARYQPLRLHAKGGLGEVFVAHDGELNRNVALKQLQNRFADDRERQARFLAEGEITARLEHPGVVPVYGRGADENDRPYYAMRFIKGQSLDEAVKELHAIGDARARRRELRRLLSRFLAVCAVIEYAHSRGVIHRDLKPLNIMLGKYNETLVVDWGMAIAVDPLTAAAASESIVRADGMERRHHGTSGTVGYMSPEQAAPDSSDVGRPSDVFGLGATLYCLLTGQAPFRNLHAARRCEFLRPREVSPTTPRPLDAICRKAMSCAPQQRFASAAELAENIECWLNDEPVPAYQESIPERAERWTRRHRSWTLAAVATLVAVTICSITAVLGIARAQAYSEQQRTIADANLQLAQEAVDEMLTAVAQERLENIPQLEDVREDILTDALKYYELFLKADPINPTARLIVAKARHRIAEIDRLRGQSEGAGSGFRHAIDELTQLAKDYPNEPIYQHELGDALNSLGKLLRKKNPSEATRAYDQALVHQERLVEQYPDHADRVKFAIHLARSHYNRGIVAAETGHLESAQKDYDTARSWLATTEESASSASDKDDCIQHIARVETNLGNLAFTRQKLPAALEHHQKAVDLAKELYHRHSDRRDIETELGSYHNNLANLLLEMAAATGGNVPYLNDAAMQSAQAVEHFQSLTAGLPDLRSELGNCYISRGTIFQEQERQAESHDEFTAAIAIFEELEREDQKHVDYADRLGNALQNRAFLNISKATTGEAGYALALSDLDRAIQLHTKAINLAGQNHDYQLHLQRDYGSRATALLGCGEHVEAANVVNLYLGLAPEDPRICLDAADFLSSCVEQAVKVSGKQAAEEYTRRAVTLVRKAIERGPVDVNELEEGFGSIRNDPEFKSLLVQLRESKSPSIQESQ